MKWLFIFLLAFPAYAYNEVRQESDFDRTDVHARNHGKARAKELGDQVQAGKLLKFANLSDWALDNLVDRGVERLRAAGRKDEADWYQAEWTFHFSGTLTRLEDARLNARDIGDHQPLLKWLAGFYDLLELALGVEVCKALHLSDIKTFNYTVPVVFRPCTFPMDHVTATRRDEYRNHFSAGKVYYGLFPVVTYWAVDVPCMIGTAGLAALLCGPAASVGEWFCSHTVAPWLSDRIFDGFCGGSND